MKKNILIRGVLLLAFLFFQHSGFAGGTDKESHCEGVFQRFEEYLDFVRQSKSLEDISMEFFDVDAVRDFAEFASDSGIQDYSESAFLSFLIGFPRHSEGLVVEEIECTSSDSIVHVGFLADGVANPVSIYLRYDGSDWAIRRVEFGDLLLKNTSDE